MLRKIFLIILYMLSALAYSQNNIESEGKGDFKKHKILLLRELSIDERINEIGDRFYSELFGSASNLGRFEILNEISQDFSDVNNYIGNDSNEADEIILFKILFYSQEKVIEKISDNQVEEDHSFLAILLKPFLGSSVNDEDEVVISYVSYIKTQLQRIDPVSGNIKQSIVIDESYSGPSEIEADKGVESLFRTSMDLQLRKMFLLEGRIINEKSGKYYLNLGSNAGLKRNMTFKVLEPDFTSIVDGEEYVLPGSSAGIISIKDISENTSSSMILRSWEKIKKDYVAVEHPDLIWAASFDYLHFLEDECYSTGVNFHLMPLNAFDFGLSFRYLLTEDSYEEYDSGLGLGVFSSFRILKIWIMDLNIKAGIDVDYFFKTDDNSNNVSAMVLSPYVASFLDVMMTRNADISLEFQYRFAGSSDSWSYTEEDETNAAVWLNDNPEIDFSGMCFSISCKYYFF